MDTRKAVGKHVGKEVYTIGQKANISGMNDKYYIVDKNTCGGDMLVCKGAEHASLYSHTLQMSMKNHNLWVTDVAHGSIVIPCGGSGKIMISENIRGYYACLLFQPAIDYMIKSIEEHLITCTKKPALNDWITSAPIVLPYHLPRVNHPIYDEPDIGSTWNKVPTDSHLCERSPQVKYKGITSTIKSKRILSDSNVNDNNAHVSDLQLSYDIELTVEGLSAIHRYHQPLTSCIISMNFKLFFNPEEQKWILELDELNDCINVYFPMKQRAIASGQTVAFYDHDVCLGGGIII